MDAYIIDGCRTPIGNLGGGLSGIRADDLAATVIRSLMESHPELEASAIGDVLFGCANQAGEDNRNVARMAALLAGLPPTVPGETINRLCASGLAATVHGARMVAQGDADVVIAGGVEHMTRAPYVMSKPSTGFGRDAQWFDTTFGWRFVNPAMKAAYGVDGMGETAENLVDLYGISREDQDRFANWSQQKAAERKADREQDVIEVRITRSKLDDLVMEHDEFVKSDTSVEGLSKLRPAFRKDGGTVTAGNASGLNDGAVALLVGNSAAIQKHHWQPIAQILSSAVVGVEPRIMGIGPVEASNRALERAGLTMADMDVIEINEAFAAQALACIRAWGLDDFDPRINPCGGAIAMGHPLGMTGGRIVLAAARELERTSKRYALVTLCIGVGQGYAVVLERASL